MNGPVLLVEVESADTVFGQGGGSCPMSLTARAFAWTFASSRSNLFMVANPALNFLSFVVRRDYGLLKSSASAASDHVSPFVRSFRDMSWTASSCPGVHSAPHKSPYAPSSFRSSRRSASLGSGGGAFCFLRRRALLSCRQRPPHQKRVGGGGAAALGAGRWWLCGRFVLLASHFPILCALLAQLRYALVSPGPPRPGLPFISLL